jgi:hypothetical protein
LSTYVWMELEKLDDDNLELVVTLARRIWLCRNFVVYGRFKLVKNAKDSIDEFHQATQVNIRE